MIDAAGPWGTGPFVLMQGFSQIKKRSPKLVLEPNPSYWNPERKPNVKQITFDNRMSKAKALHLVSTTEGKVDIVTELTPAEAAQVAKSKYAKVVRSDAKTVLVGVFNQKAPNSRWTDIRLRKAVNYAVDREGVLQTRALGYGVVIPAMITPGSFGYNPELKPYSFDPSQAKKLMREAGLQEGATFTIVAGADWKPTGDAISKNLQSVGMRVKPVWADAPKGDTWDLWLVAHFDWSPEFPAGVVHREFFAKDGGFRMMKEDPAFDQMYATLAATRDRAQQEKLVQQMEKYVYDQANVLFLYAPSKLYAVSNRVSFVPYKTTMLELAETAVAR